MSTYRRTLRWLDAALCHGAFEVNGPLYGLDADDIADEMARDWDDEGKRGRLEWHTGNSNVERSDILPYVERWMAINDIGN